MNAVIGLFFAAMLLLWPAAAGAQQAAAPPLPKTAFAGMEIAWGVKTAAHQHDLLARAFSGLAPQRAGVRDVYVLAAGLWGDPVFEREASTGARILAERFGAVGRTLILSNGGDEGAGAYPAATPVHIQAALGRLAAVMDPQEDVLILFLTSHGTVAGMGVEDGRRMKATLTPSALRAALDETGVRDRIVILSACHSGVFIPALATPSSVVLTAAAREKVSFGCAAENDWTYFGEALFDGALKRGRGLTQAFTEAKALIARKELAERQIPSDPQIFVGAEAGGFMAALDQIKP